MRIKTLLAAAAMLFTGMFASAGASPLSYTLSGDVTGSIGATTLSGAHFSWTITTDTTLFGFTPPYFIAPALTDVIQISGVGAATPITSYFYDQAPGLGAGVFVGPLKQESVGFSGNGLIGYDGQTAIGPLPVTLASGSSPVQTSDGTFLLSSTSALQFSAVFITPSSVPEPLTLALFGVGLAGISALRRRKA